MTIENREYAAFARRVVRSFGKRLAENPDELGELLAMQREVDQALHAAVTSARSAYGLSWAEVGELLGVTRQAAQQRFGAVSTSSGVDGEQPLPFVDGPTLAHLRDPGLTPERLVPSGC